MDKDWIERDRLLSEVHTATKFIKDELARYVAEDKLEHQNIKSRVFWLTIGVVVIGVMIGGPSFAMMFLK